MAPLGALSLLLLLSAVADGQKTAERADRSPPLQVLDNNADDGYLPANSTTANHGYLPLPPAGHDAASTSLENKDAAAFNYLPTSSEEPEEPAAVTTQPAIRVPIRMVVRVRPSGNRRRTTTPSTPSVQDASSSTEPSVTEDTTADVATPATAPASTEAGTDIATSTSAPPVSNEATTDAPATRRKIMKKRIRVISHKLVAETADLVEVSTTTETAAVVTTEAQSETSTKTATEAASEAPTIAPSIVQYPVRRRGRKRNTNQSSPSTSSSENPPSTSSGLRRVIRRQGHISGGDETSSVSTRTPGGSSTNSKNPIKRRRIISRKKGSPAADTAYPAASSLAKQRRARRPLVSVSALDTTSGGEPSVQPLLVRPRVARHDGAISSALRVRKGDKNRSSPSTSSSENPPSTSSGIRRVIRRQGHISGGDETSLVSTRTPDGSSTNYKNPIKRRRIIIRKKGSPVTDAAHSATSSPANKRRARQPLESVSALDAISGGEPSVQPLLVRPRVTHHDGATSSTPDAPVRSRIIRRRGRFLDSTSSSSPSSAGSQEDSAGATAVTRKISRRRGRAKNLDASSSSPAAQEASVSVSSGSPAPTRRRVRARAKARRRPSEEAATLADFTGSGGVSLVRPLVFRPRIARARGAVSAPDAIAIGESSPSSGSASQQITRSRGIRRRGGQRVATAATATAGQPVATEKDRIEAGSQTKAGKITRKIIRRRRPSAGSNSVATPSATKPILATAFSEEPKGTVATQQLTTTAEQPTSAEQLSLTSELPRTTNPSPGPTEQPNATPTTEAAPEASTVGFTGVLAGLPNVLAQGRQYQVIDRYPSSASTDTPSTTPAPISRIRKVFRPKSSLRGIFAKADRVQTTAATRPPLPPPQVGQLAPLSAVSSLHKHTEAGANINHIGDLQSTLPAGGGTVVGDRPVSQFSCDSRPYGYYADMEADCQVFHICTPVVQTNGAQQMLKHSFFCNNGTVFDQSTLSCRVTRAALPCGRSGEFYASVDFFSQYNYFDQLRQDQERRDEQARQQQQQQQQQQQRLETLEDLERLEAQLA